MNGKIRYTFLFILLFILNGISQDPTIGLIQNTPEAVNGYTLFSSNRTTYLIDNCGFIVNQWESNFNPGLSVYLLENGDLLRTTTHTNNENLFVTGKGGGIELYNWEGDSLWHFNYYDSLYHAHHDIEMLPNGNIIILAHREISYNDALNKGRIFIDSSIGIWSEYLVEVDPSNNFEIVWEWEFWDHVIQNTDPTLSNFANPQDKPGKIDINLNPNIQNYDWIHANAVAYNPILDQIAITSRNLNEIFIIDHSTTTAEAKTDLGGNSGKGGQILYRWGNPQNYGQGTEDDKKLWGPHDIKWIPEGYVNEHKLIVFNNGYQRPVPIAYSSVDIWTPPLDENNEYILEQNSAYGPTELDWSYTDDSFYSSNRSGANPLSNGNILVCEGTTGRFTEITPQKEKVWEYINPQFGNFPIPQGEIPTGNAIFRATRYPENHPAFMDKDLTPGIPVELDPYPSLCQIFQDTTSQDTTTGIFSPILELNDVYLIQNPIINEIKISNTKKRNLEIDIFDQYFRKINFKTSNQEIIHIPISNAEQGIFFIRLKEINSQRFTYIKSIKVN